MKLEEVPVGTVVVGVDGSASSANALAWAIDLATAERRALIIVHAVGPLGAAWTNQDGTDIRTGLADGTPLLQEGHRILDQACHEARRTAPELEVHDVLRVADPRDVLIGLSERASVLVVGSRGRGPVRTLLLGSVSVAVVRHAACPTVVTRPGTRPLEGNAILVGIHGSASSTKTLRFAYRQASRRRLPLVVLHTYLATRPPAGTLAPEDQQRATATTTTVTEEGEALSLTEVISAMQEDYPDVAVETELVYGLPGECLLQRSSGMNMVVVGTSSGGPASELLFGSIAAFIVEHATCAVTVVPVGDAD